MVTDTAFTKSNLENRLLKVVILGTSKDWSYHTGFTIIHKISETNSSFHVK